MSYHLSAVPRGGNHAIPASIRTVAMAEDVLGAAAALAMLYPPDTHVVRLITSCRTCDDERVALRMLAQARGMALELI